MKTLFKYATVVLLLAGTSACSQPSKRASIIDENIAVAEKQIGMLADSSETGGVIRIPSTWKNGRIDYVPVDDWVSGFFAGTLWYMYELTGDEAWVARARKHTEILDSVQYLQWHHDVGFMVYDSYGNGLRLKNIPGYEDVIVQTAKSLATRFRPVPGVIQSWDADRGWQGERGWQCPVIIDNMMNLELMFKATEFSGDSTYYNIAVKHADRTMKEHFRDDYSCYHVVDYDLTDGHVRGRCTAQGYADDSAWARGQAWGIYGFALGFRHNGDITQPELARKLTHYFLNRLPEDFVCYWDLIFTAEDNQYRDTSAAAIAACGVAELLKLLPLTEPQRPAYGNSIELMMRNLREHYFAHTQDGLLREGVYNFGRNMGINEPNLWGDYFYFEALVRLSRVWTPYFC